MTGGSCRLQFIGPIKRALRGAAAVKQAGRPRRFPGTDQRRAPADSITLLQDDTPGGLPHRGRTGGWGEVGAAGEGSPQPLVPGRLACHRLSRPRSPRWVCEPGFHQGLCCRVVGSRGRGHMRAEQGERKCSRAEKPPNSDAGQERARPAQWGVWNGDPPPMGSGGVRRAPRGGPQPGAGPGAPSSRPPARSWGARRKAGHVPVAATRLPGAGFVTVLEACDLGDFMVTVMLLLTHCERRGRVSGTLRTPGRAHALTRLGRATRSCLGWFPLKHPPAAAGGSSRKWPPVSPGRRSASSGQPL